MLSLEMVSLDLGVESESVSGASVYQTGEECGETFADHLPPQRLRRLTRREHANTLQDLLSLIEEEHEQEEHGRGDQLVAALPLDLRPERYPFDNFEYTAQVTADYMDEQLKIAAQVIDQILTQLDYIPCVTATGHVLNDLDEPCQREVIRRLGEHILRAPLSDDQLERSMRRVHQMESVSEGLSVALQVLLLSPQALYRAEVGLLSADHQERAHEERGERRDRETDTPAEVIKLTSWELASALSYGLWGGPPDAELRACARADLLQDPDQLEIQALRLLNHPKAQEHFGEFAVQWLGVEKLIHLDKNMTLYPDFTSALRGDLLAETRTFVTDIIRHPERGFRDLITAQFTWLTPRLHEHYKLTDPLGVTHSSSSSPAPSAPSSDEESAEGMRGEELGERIEDGRVMIYTAYSEGAGERSGILSHGSVLSRYAHSNQTSPILRGLFVRERLLCQSFAPPPANAGGVPELDPTATTRERFRQHSEDPSCQSCHQFIDEVGFGFERFDPTGRYRQRENGRSIDQRGVLRGLNQMNDPTPHPFNTLLELGDLIAQSERARGCFVTQMYRFIFGVMGIDEGEYALHPINGFEECTIPELRERFQAEEINIRSLILHIVRARPFRFRRRVNPHTHTEEN